jgi:hypothetical protein
LKVHAHEAIPLLRVSVDNRRCFYVRASRYRRLLHSVANRVLGNPDRADIAVENCLFSASHRVTAFDCEGAFRSWLVRIAIDQALAILHGRSIPEHGRDWSLQEAEQRCSHQRHLLLGRDERSVHGLCRRKHRQRNGWCGYFGEVVLHPGFGLAHRSLSCGAIAFYP